MHVIIIGGGLGGLSLAQALPAAGVEATVYERDPFARGQGYRIHLNPEADAICRSARPLRCTSATGTPAARPKAAGCS